jgi:hypothetical protein
MTFLGYALFLFGVACLWGQHARPRSPAVKVAVGGFCALALVSLCYFSLNPYYAVGNAPWLRDFDTRYWYAGGKCWLSGASPYDPVAFRQAWTEAFGEALIPAYGLAFVYPPTLLLVAAPVSLLPWSMASLVVRLLGCGAFLGILWVSARLAGSAAGARPAPAEPWLYAGFSALLLPVSQTLFQGQTSLFVVLGIVLAVYAWTRGSLLLLVAGCVLASMKPQISLLMLVYVLGAAGWRKAAAGAATVAGVSAALVLRVPTAGLLDQVRSSLEIHGVQVFNQLDNYDSLAGLFGATPFGKAFQRGFIAAGVLAALALVRSSRPGDDRSTTLRRVLALAAVSMAVMPIHRYDATLYVLIVMALVTVAGLRDKILVIAAVFLHGYVWDGRVSTLLALPWSGFDVHRAMERDNFGLAGHASALVAGVILAILLALPDLRPRVSPIVQQPRAGVWGSPPSSINAPEPGRLRSPGRARGCSGG